MNVNYNFLLNRMATEKQQQKKINSLINSAETRAFAVLGQMVIRMIESETAREEETRAVATASA